MGNIFGGAPKPPDPYKVAAAQTETNINTAREQARLAMTGQETPTGSIQYVKDPSSPSGYRAVTNLSPEQQALLAQQQDLTAQYGTVAGGQLGRVGDTMAQPFDMSAARGTEISDIHRTMLDPVWNQRGEALQTDLINRGIRPGSEAYDREMAMFNRQRNDAYNQMFLASYDTANRAALTERNQPMAELAALRGGYQGPGAAPVSPAASPTPGVAPTDLTSGVYQTYGIQQGASNAAMGGLYGLGGSVLGGWAMSPGGISGGLAGLGSSISGGLSSLAALSDRRVKTEIRRIGTDPRGWGLYMFKYIIDEIKGAAPWLVGYMADEVEKIRPDAVHTDPQFGTKSVNYGALAMA